MEKNIKKIMFHINSLERGGAERVVTVLSAELAKMGYEVSIATEWQKENEYPLPNGVKRLDVGLGEEEGKLSRSARIRKRITLLHDAIVEEKPDVLFAFLRNNNYRAVAAAKGTDTEVIVSERSDPRAEYASKAQKLLAAYYYGAAAGCVFQTKQAQDFFGSGIRKKSCVILNPLDRKYLEADIDAPKRKAIVCAARIVYVKDHMTLLRAYERVIKKHPDYVLELYGGRGEDNAIFQLKEQIRSHSLEDKVKLFGPCNDLEKRLPGAAVSVLASKFEGMPNSIMEAMAMGIPCVASDCPGGVRMLVKDGETGLLFRTGDDAELAAGICKMIENPKEAERIAKTARESVLKCTPEMIANEWLEYAKKVRR